ncbi:MAG: putative acyl-CoA dehydrogenase, partial [Gammaproteobacteria bacterium]
REAAAIPAIISELELAAGANAALDRAIDSLKNELGDSNDLEYRARELTERLALTLQGSLLVRHAPAAVAYAFCASRFESNYHGAFGTLPRGCDVAAIIERNL